MILHRKYPLTTSNQQKWNIILGLSIFIPLFLATFQPFELSHPAITDRYLKIAGYGVVTFTVLTFFLFGLLPLFKEENWTVLKEILYVLSIVITIGIFNYWYSFWVFDLGVGNLKIFLNFLFFTLAVGIFPITVLVFWKQNHLNKRYRSDATAINQSLQILEAKKVPQKQLVQLLGEYKDNLSLNPSQLLFIESSGNYVHIHYLKNEENHIAQLRSSLKKIHEQLSSFEYLFKCHRAFIVNLNHIQQVGGNAQGLRLTIQNSTKEIPVARSMVKEFKAIYEDFEL